MPRKEPKIGTKGPERKGGGGGGLSREAVAEATQRPNGAKPRSKASLSLPRAEDTRRNVKALKDLDRG